MDKTEICNLAIGWVGGNPIMSFEDEESTEAELCRLSWDATRDYVLEQRDWTFAADRDSLVPLTEAPAFEYDQQFQLPSDLLVVRRVSDRPYPMRNIDYVKEGRKILANAANLYIKYTVAITDENLFSPSFTYALAYQMASVIAIPLTGGANLAKQMEAHALMIIDGGGSIDGTQTKVGRAYASKIVGARLR